MGANNFGLADGRGWTLMSKRFGEAVYNLGGFYADADYLAYQADDVAGVVFTVGVGRGFLFWAREWT